MKVSQTKGNKQVIFTWTKCDTECEFVTLGGVTDEELNNLIENDGHDAHTVDGWEMSIIPN